MLEFRNVSVNVSKTPILEDISVAFEKGVITSIIGPNGCGKTTLLQTLNGVSKVTGGEILIDGENYLNFLLRERARRLSFMPQLRESAPGISVKGLVEHGRFTYMGFSRKMSEEDVKAVNSAIEYVKLNEYRECLVSELSGGMQQRAYLAMQLAQNSDYLVMDEPMNYLDFPGQREMYQLIKRLGNEGKTVIMVLHDLNRALQISDRIVVMNNRKIIFNGTPEDCLNKNVIREVFDCDVRTMEFEDEKHFVFI